MTATVTSERQSYRRYKARYERNKRAQIKAGTWQPRASADDVDRARDHIEAHARAGIGTRRLAELAEVSRNVVQAIRHGGRRGRPLGWARRDILANILAVPVSSDPAADHAKICAAGTQRRVQALAAIGWSLAAQAERIGQTAGNYSRILDQPQVRASTARLIAGVYDQLQDTPAPNHDAAQTRSWAQAQGWFPPLAWDDDTIDDPDVGPALALLENGEDADEGLVWLALNGHLELEELPVTERTVVRRHLRDATRAVAA